VIDYEKAPIVFTINIPFAHGFLAEQAVRQGGEFISIHYRAIFLRQHR